MLKNNPNFNYKYFDRLLTLKQRESDTVADVVHQIMEIFTKIYNGRSSNKGVYYIKREIKYTTDIDPTYCIDLQYAIGVVQDLYIDLPLIQNQDTILINGNIYNPMLQMIDKPLYMKGKTKTAVLQTNLGIFTTGEISNERLIRFNATGFHNFHPPILLYFLYYLGGNLKSFEDYTGVKYSLLPGIEDMPFKDFVNDKGTETKDICFVDLTNVKPQFKDPKFEILAKQINKLSISYNNDFKSKEFNDKYANITVGDFFKGLYSNEFCQSYMSVFITNNLLKKFNCHQELVVKLDIFSAHFMVYKTVYEELLRAFSTSAQYIDIKDLSNKRFRCYELYLLTFLKHVYNLGMNTLYSKIATVSKEKRLRIYDNIRGSTSATKDVDGKSPAYSFDGGRNNSIMRLTEMTKINQTGEGGLTAEMFVGAARDLHDSQYGTLCPITTPDREKCGVTLYLVPSNLTKFDSMYYWPCDNEHMEDREPLKSKEEYEVMWAEHSKTFKKKAEEVTATAKEALGEDEDETRVVENSSDHVDTGDEETSTSDNRLFINDEMNDLWGNR